MQDILKLSVPERILMVQAIWYGVAENDKKPEVTEEIKQLLDERIEAHKNNPNEGSSWGDVKARIEAQL